MHTWRDLRRGVSLTNRHQLGKDEEYLELYPYSVIPNIAFNSFNYEMVQITSQTVTKAHSVFLFGKKLGEVR